MMIICIPRSPKLLRPPACGGWWTTSSAYRFFQRYSWMILEHFLGKTYWQHLATNRRFDPHPRGFRFIWLYSGKGIQAHKFIFQWLGHHQSHAGFSGGTSCTPEMHSPRRCCPPPCYIKPLSFWKNQSSRGSIHFFLEFAFCVRIHCHFDRGQVKKQTVLLKFMLKPWIDQYLKPIIVCQ